MIGYISGELVDFEEESVLIDNHGIGYRIYMPGSSMERCGNIGDMVKIFTYLNVKEDLMQLYGFITKDDLQTFKKILNVSGIGPKGALAILSSLTSDQLKFAVLADDAATIAKTPGIGKKTAQKLILELKDKFDLEETFESSLSHTEQATAAAGNGSAAGAKKDAIEALVALGYSGAEATKAVRNVEATDDMDSEAILKAALKKLF